MELQKKDGQSRDEPEENGSKEKRKFMLSMVRGIIVTAAVMYTAVLFKSPSLALAGYAGAALVAAACLFLVYRAYTVQCYITFPISIAVCGKPLTVRILVDNQSFLPCQSFRCRLEVRNRFLKRRRKKWLRGGMAAAGNNSYDYTIVINDYGSYEISIQKLRVYDLTGLFYIHKKVKKKGTVQVLPDMREIGIHITEAARNFFGDSDVYDDFRPGDDHSELFQIRPFQNGDKIQSIHWKLSAKMDDLLVKDDSLPKACPVVFLLDYQKERQRSAQRVNAYLVILASISFSMMDAGCPHYAAWYSGERKDIVRVRVDDEESLYLFLSCYLEEQFQVRNADLTEIYREKYRGENYLYLLQFDQSLTLLKNAEKIAEFALHDWEKKLSGLELVL